MRSVNLVLLPPIFLKLQKLTFFYFKFFIFLLNKFKILNNKNKKIVSLFVDISKDSSYLVRTICVKFNHYFVLNRWLFGLITNRVQILTKAKRLMNDEVFFYNYNLPRIVPQLIFFINPIFQKQYVEEEISSLNCPIIYIIKPKEYILKLKKNYFLMFFYHSTIRLFYFLLFFSKLLRHLY